MTCLKQMYILKYIYTWEDVVLNVYNTMVYNITVVTCVCTSPCHARKYHQHVQAFQLTIISNINKVIYKLA